MRSKSEHLNILITGVSRGLGRAMVNELAGDSSKYFHTVLGCARTKKEIAMLARKYPRHHFQQLDVASDSQVQDWASYILKEYGPPDFILNNAAVINRKAPLWRVGSRSFSQEIDINIKGVFNLIRQFVPSMLNRSSGVIVNFSSRWGKHVEQEMAPYCATKWAVLALTRSLAEELKPKGITAVCLNPGIVKTGMLQRYLGNAKTDPSAAYPEADQWAKIAIPFILRLGMKDSGKFRTVPTL